VRVEELAASASEARAELAAMRTALAELAQRMAAENDRTIDALAEFRAELAATRAELAAVQQRTAHEHRRTLEVLRVVRDDDSAAWRALWRLRKSEDYALAFDEDEPLVSVIIPTYSGWELMRERALPSLLAQSYERYECIVVGDAAPPEAEKAVSSFRDNRLRFVNLPYRGPYPDDPRDAWLVAGTTPCNTGLALADGRWILYASDDDSMRPRCIESLLELARARRAEVPYGQLHLHRPDGDVELLGVFPPRFAQWGTQAALLHAGLPYLWEDPSDWMFGMPNDWSMADKMLRIGVRFAMLEEPIVDYYPSRLWTDRSDPRPEFA
jgi:cellulose synthase/poly-beta-1,6-N-acetylglucosamine synthase-like glycosyltransferase